MSKRIAFITSGATGLGYAAVRSLLKSGWDVGFTYRNGDESADALLAEARALGRRAIKTRADLLDKDQVLQAVNECMHAFGHIDAFIHNFGPFVFERVPLEDYSDEMWNRMLTGNLTNFFWVYRAVIGQMRRQGFGRLITIGYDGAANAAGWRFRAAYAAAKAGLASITRSIAREERQNGITVNMVCPGDIRGDLKTREIADVYRADDRLGRAPVGEDVARMIAWLCEPHSQQVNGTVMEVTGGYDIRAYDDGKDVVTESPVFSIGEQVFVHPWQKDGYVLSIDKVQNRSMVYLVRSGEMQGSFTQYQLSEYDGK